MLSILSASCGTYTLGGLIMMADSTTETTGRSKKGLISILGCGLGAWLVTTGSQEPIDYERTVWGGLFLWVTVLVARSWVRQLGATPNPDAPNLSRRMWQRLPPNILLSLAPGAILLWYGLAAPQKPSYTRGGIDICDLQVGLCVSGTRAFIFFGIVLLVFGLSVVYLLIRRAING